MNEELRNLKAQKAKLLNRKCETEEEFEIIQDRLNEIEFKIKQLKEER